MAILVYKLTCAVSGKSYVGITARALDTRWLEHCARARQGLRRGSRLYDALRKYGPDAWTREIIGTTDTQEQARSLECAFIRQLDTFANGYNANEGGHGWLVVPEDVRKKIGAAQADKKNSPQARRKMSEAKLGRAECAGNFGKHTQKGVGNPRAIWFVMSCPDGTLRIESGLRAFIRKHGLHYRHLKTRGHSKGFHLLDRFHAAPTTALTLT